MVVLYLAAIVASNFLVARFGANVSILTAFAFIGLVITTRDRLHDKWGDHLARNMGALILGGSAISFLLGGEVQRIAIASGVAFMLSESVDATAYHLLREQSWYKRANGSNAVSAVVDSVLFPMIAFGGFLPLITLGQFAAKVFGGAIWSAILKPRTAVVAAVIALASPVAGQSVSVGLGEYHNEFVTQEVVEVVILGPVWAVRPNMIVSFDLDGTGEPVVIPQIGRDIVQTYPVVMGVDVGAVMGPFDDYHPEPSGSLRVMAFLPHGFKVITIASWQPWNGWARSLVAKLDWSLF